MELTEDQAQEWAGEAGTRALLIRLPEDLFDTLDQLSRNEDASMNKLITRILRRATQTDPTEASAGSPEVGEVAVPLESSRLPTRVYINYPNPHLTIHGTADGFYRRADVATRLVRITRANKAEELKRFTGGFYPFGASAGVNGIWIEIDLGNFEEEVELAREIWKRLGVRYTRLIPAPFTIHCGA